MRRARAAGGLAAALLVAASLYGCSAAGKEGAQGPPVKGTEVTVTDNVFEPGILEVRAGKTVTWTWEGDSPHDVASEDFSSEIMTEGSFEHTFEEPGRYDYRCTVHQGMEGRIVVVRG